MKLHRIVASAWILGIASFVLAGDDGTAKLPAEPAKVDIGVAPAGAAPGSTCKVTVRLTPKDGIKINRYPKMRLKVEAHNGLTGAAEVAVGNDTAPPPEQVEANYFKSVDPIELPLKVDAAAAPGAYDLKGQLTYYYCVAASGFCAPKKMPVTIPIIVR